MLNSIPVKRRTTSDAIPAFLAASANPLATASAAFADIVTGSCWHRLFPRPATVVSEPVAHPTGTHHRQPSIGGY